MRKPRLTEKVLRGLIDCVSAINADNTQEMQENGILQSADDVEAADEWLTKMVEYRQRRAADRRQHREPSE